MHLSASDRDFDYRKCDGRVTTALKTRTMVNGQENHVKSMVYRIAYILGIGLGILEPPTIRLPSTQVLHKNIPRSGGNRLTVLGTAI